MCATTAFLKANCYLPICSAYFPGTFPSFINRKSMWILCLQSACPLWEWKMNVYQRLAHFSTACIRAHHSSSHKGLVYVLLSVWQHPGLHLPHVSGAAMSPNHLQTLTNISWRQTLQANHSRQRFIPQEHSPHKLKREVSQPPADC